MPFIVLSFLQQTNDFVMPIALGAFHSSLSLAVFEKGIGSFLQ